MRLYLGLGSNIGDRKHYLTRAVESLAQAVRIKVARCSSVYETAPIGPEQPAYLNAVVEVETDLRPREVLDLCKGIERAMGRAPGGIRWGPRILDIDLLLLEKGIVSEPGLQVPHPELHRRAFALRPLCELVPDACHPILNMPLKFLLDTVADQEARIVDDLKPTGQAS